MIELGMASMNQYTSNIEYQYGAAVSLDFRRGTMKDFRQLAQQDRKRIEAFVDRKTLTGTERQDVDSMRQRWRTAMAQMLIYGKDVERDLIDYMEAQQGNFLAHGGRPHQLHSAASDTVPAMLTPGEFVVRKEVVNNVGIGFLERLNNLNASKDVLKQKVQGFASGGLVALGRSLASVASGAQLAMPQFALANAATAAATNTGSVLNATPSKTLRVELASGNRVVAATVNASDEAALLELLKQAQSRSR
jgi:hypothetical protein